MSAMEYCGCLTLAANRLAIPVMHRDDAYHFYDTQTRVLVSGKSLSNPKRQLLSACIALNRYLCK